MLSRFRCCNALKTYRAISTAPSRKIAYPPSRVRAAFLFGALATSFSIYLFYPDASRSASTSAERPLSPSHFTPAKIISSEACGPNAKLLTIAVPPHLLPHTDESAVWSIFVKDDDIQVERPYTPLKGLDKDGQMLFWIKRYPKGEVGRWIHSKAVGEDIEIRGPLKTWPWKDNTWDEVVMISGGTGITPFYQLFHTVISSASSPKTRFTLLHSSKTLEELPPSAILEPLIQYSQQNPERFRFHAYIDSNTRSTRQVGLKPQTKRIDKLAIQQALGIKQDKRSWWPNASAASNTSSNRKVLFLICGPESMINAIAGPYGRNFSQGAVGGVLSELGYTSDHVWKL